MDKVSYIGSYVRNFVNERSTSYGPYIHSGNFSEFIFIDQELDVETYNPFVATLSELQEARGQDFWPS